MLYYTYTSLIPFTPIPEEESMALINCPECNSVISDKSKLCINCGYPLKQTGIKIQLITGIILFIFSMHFGLSTLDTELFLRAKKLSEGLQGIEQLKWFFLRYAPNFLLVLSITMIGLSIFDYILLKIKRTT